MSEITNNSNGVTRREFEDLRVQVRQQASDATTIAVISSQLATFNRDLTDLKREMNGRFDTVKTEIEGVTKGVNDKFRAHSEEHGKDVEARTTGRRWMITTAVAVLVALTGLYGFIAFIVRG